MEAINWIKFEDDFFEVKEGKLVQANSKFNPLICCPKWFFNTGEVETAESLQNQANYCYWTKDYTKAACLYEKALNRYFCNNPFMKRNLLESIARCHLQLGELSKTKTLAEECLSLSYTTELKSSILHLLAVVYGSMGLLNMQKEALLQLITYHPLNYQMWWDLAHCLSNFSKSHVEDNSLHTMMEAACLIRLSTIIRTMKSQDGILQLQKAEGKLSSLTLPENFISTGKKFYSRDLTEEYLTAEESKDLTETDNSVDAVLNAEPTTSEIYWFKWIYNFLK